MVGFKELLCRLQIQEQMTKQHQTRVDVSMFVIFSKLKKKNRTGPEHHSLLISNKGTLKQIF